MEVRRVREREWRALKDLRLRALADSPDAFGGTFAAESRRPDRDWQDWARRGAVGERDAVFVANEGGGALVGLCSCHPIDDSTMGLYSMWVDPSRRRASLGSGSSRLRWAGPGRPVLGGSG